ncbi:MAG: hypothetical protein IPN67_08260 [Bacteroidales bacterium]|nr:hypothetical protein [Bacteroidales bacterium]
MRAFKFIRSLLLLVAGMAIVAHMIIPHDHHPAGPVNGHKDICPISKGKADNHPSFPVHCHAFNDLPAEKFSRGIIKHEIQTSNVFVIWRTDSFVPGFHLSQNLSKDTGKPFPDIYLPDFLPLRAPPSTI